MTSLQYVIDTICSRLTPDAIYRLIKARLGQGAFGVDELVPLIRAGDRSLDSGSAKMLAEAAIEALAQGGEIRIEDGQVFPVD